MPIPNRPRHCTHIKVTGQPCGSPALRGEFFCYFHTRVIKGVQQRVDMQLHSMALLEDCESIQLSIMHVVDGLVRGTLDPTRARLIIQALRIAARNAKNVRFDDVHYRASEQPMVREVPDYAQQYLIEHPEAGPALSPCGAGAPAREAEATMCSAAREAAKQAAADQEPKAKPITTKQDAAQENAAQENKAQESPTKAPAAERRKNTAHGASRGTEAKPNPAPQERKNPRNEPADDNDAKEYERIKQAQAAIPGALAGNWRDLRTVNQNAAQETTTKAPAAERRKNTAHGATGCGKSRYRNRFEHGVAQEKLVRSSHARKR